MEDYVGENEFGQKMYKQLNGSVRIEGISGIGKTKRGKTTYQIWKESIKSGWFYRTFSKTGMTDKTARHYAYAVFTQQGGNQKEAKDIYIMLKRFVKIEEGGGSKPPQQDQPIEEKPEETNPVQHDVFVYIGVKDNGKLVFVSPVIVTDHNTGTAKFYWLDKKTYTELMNNIGKGIEQIKEDNKTITFLTSITAEQRRLITGDGWYLFFYRKIRITV